MTKFKSLVRREHIASVADNIATTLGGLFRQAGIPFRFKVQQSKRTGSVYLTFTVLDSNGQKVKGLGCTIRVADHRKPGQRWANFTQPAKRYYGVWCFSSPWKIVGKVNRIGRHLLDRIHRQEKGGAI